MEAKVIIGSQLIEIPKDCPVLIIDSLTSYAEFLIEREGKMHPTLITKSNQLEVLDSQTISNLMRLEMRCKVHGIIKLVPGDNFYSFYKQRAKNVNNPLPCPIGQCDEDMILVRM